MRRKNHATQIPARLARRRRRLVLEGLETRALLASDCFHNFMMPEDTDGSGELSPLDALVVINQLNAAAANNNAAPNALRWNMTDVDADETLSPLDALSVINAINESAMEQSSVPSQTDLNRRMAWIEKAITTGDLPWNYTVDDAYEALATLRRGGRPEMGDRVIHGRLARGGMQFQSDSDETDSEGTEPGSGDAGDGSDGSEFWGGDTDWNITIEQPWLSRILNRLSAVGASDELLTRVETALQPLADSPNALESFDEVKGLIEDLLAEANIDLESVFPNHEAESVEQWIAQLKDRLATAGWNAEDVTTWIQGLQDAMNSGAPWSFETVQSKLSELGIDWKTLFLQAFGDDRLGIYPGVSEDSNGDDLDDPVEPGTADPGTDDFDVLAKWIERLSSADVSPEIIRHFVSLVESAWSGGVEWTEAEFRATLAKLGVDVQSLFASTPAPPPSMTGNGDSSSIESS
ncbi:MAG: dockerin type I domain-containing protein [Pirellula sp.]